MLGTRQMRPDPVHMHPHIADRTRPRPTFMKRLHPNRKVALARPTIERLTPLYLPRRGSCNVLTMLQRPFVDVAAVPMHNQVTQYAVVWRRDVQFPIRFEDVSVARDTEEGVFAGGYERRLCSFFLGDALVDPVRDSGEVVVFLGFMDHEVAGLAIPWGDGV